MIKSQIREYMWLLAAVVCFITGIHQTFTQGISNSYVFFIFTALALLLYLLRRNHRKNKDYEN